MSSIDDLLDDIHWSNVQDPIKQMFLAVSKAIRVQGAAIRDLDRRCNERPTIDQASRMVKNDFDRSCSKQDATQIIYQLESKVSHKEFRELENSFNLTMRQMSSLSDEVESQRRTIASLTAQLEIANREIDELKCPKFDIIYDYIDRSINNLQNDVNNKLSTKAEKRDVENALPQRLEDLYRNLYSKYQELRAEINKYAIKDDVERSFAEKADVRTVRELSSAVHERVTRHEVQQAILQHLKSIVQTIASMEKQSQSQENVFRDVQKEMQQRLSKVSEVHQEIINSNILLFLKNNHNLLLSNSSDYVVNLVNNVLQEKNLLDLSSVALSNMVTSQLEQVYKQLHLMTESIRLEIITTHREDMNTSKSQIHNALEENNKVVKEAVDKVSKTRLAVKELSINIAKALSKKLDRSEFYKEVRVDCTGGKVAMEQIMQKSRELLKTGCLDGDEVKDEFDFLISSIKKDKSEQTGRYEAEEERNREGSFSDEDVATECKASAGPKGIRSRTRHPRQRINKITTTPTDSVACADAQELKVLRRELQEVKELMKIIKAPVVPLPYSSFDAERMDWRMAVGDLGMNLRKEIGDKISREEVYSLFHSETSGIEKRLEVVEKKTDDGVKSSDFQKIDNELSILKTRIAGELIGARYLWTSGQLVAGTTEHLLQRSQVGSIGYIPWEISIVNSAPALYLWKKGTTHLIVRMAGLYLISVRVFITEQVSLVVYLNDEPLFNFAYPSAQELRLPSSASSAAAVVRKSPHSAGEVASVGIEEYVSLPADAKLTVLYASTLPAQGFLALRKI